MSQISVPVRILLIGAVVFLAAWFTVLSPKPAEVEPTTTTTTTTPPTTGPGKAVEAAKEAAKQAGRQSTTTPETATKSATAPAAKAEAPAAVAIPAETLATLPKNVAGALKARKVLVLGVLADNPTSYRPLADDDRYVRNNLRHVNKYDGSVFVKSVPLSKLSRYGSLVNDLGVNQTPSIVVIDANLKGTVLTGYVDTVAINQSIADARRDSIHPNIKDPYLRQANELCGNYETRATRWSLPTVGGKKARSASFARALDIGRTYRRAVARRHAPAKWRSLKSQWVDVMETRERRLAAIFKASKTGTAADVAAALAADDSRAEVRLDRRFDKVGLTNCSQARRS